VSFDWTKLEGYREDMTADEKLALLDNMEQTEENQPKPTGATVSKVQFDKVSSELAALKKQLRSRMNEDEQKEADRQASETAMKEELETLRKEKTVSNHKAQYLSMGYDEQTAEDAANAMANGDSDEVFTIMKKAQAVYEKNLRAKILKETPTPPAGDDTNKEKEEEALLRKWFGLPPKG